MKFRIFIALASASLAGCASDGPTRVTTTSPPKCFFDSNHNRQRCSDALAAGGYAQADPRAYRRTINTPNPLVNALYGTSNPRVAGYAYGYDARFEAGYRTASRFDTTVYNKGIGE
ncbi:hypothetical protein GCM10019059_36020 [Camelimonas fluminis]|nr:hypothetical protein GCM10019059_36020 [Camelimonas fluminis]